MPEHHLKEILTPRLIIRPTEENDAAALYEAMNASRHDLEKWMPWGKYIGPEYALQFSRYSEISWRKKEQTHYPFVIVRKSDRSVIGAIGFNEYSQPQRGIFEMGYWVSSSFSGQGFASEAALALSHYAFDKLQAAVVFICVQNGNDKSIRIPKKIGYQYEMTREKACRHCENNTLEDFNIYSCASGHLLPALAYQCVYREQQRSLIDYNFNNFFNHKNLLPTMSHSDFMLTAPGLDSVFELEDFINHSPTIQNKYLWTTTNGLQKNRLQDFIKKSMSDSQYFLQTQDFCHLILCAKSRKVIGVILYHVRDRAVPFLILNFFWRQDHEKEDIFELTLIEVNNFIRKYFGLSRVEIQFSADQLIPLQSLEKNGFTKEGEMSYYWKNRQTGEYLKNIIFVKNTLTD